jgi:glucosamine--fructose-6-phosphate aminotransferase (isomerizing)
MCGIISSQNAARLPLDRPALLEYRGYDSFGQARVTGQGGFAVDKVVGSVGEALRSGRFDQLEPATLALAHTRWATHGGITEANPHPHISYDGTIAVVHNGVIENQMRLRRKLEADGIVFTSETDTEVAPHLIARHRASGLSLLNAIAGTVGELVGEFALGIISTEDPPWSAAPSASPRWWCAWTASTGCWPPTRWR